MKKELVIHIQAGRSQRVEQKKKRAKLGHVLITSFAKFFSLVKITYLMVLHGQFLLRSVYPLDKGWCSLDRWRWSSFVCPVVSGKFVLKLVFVWKWKTKKKTQK